jgi:hypothetical protein
MQKTKGIAKLDNKEWFDLVLGLTYSGGEEDFDLFLEMLPAAKKQGLLETMDEHGKMPLHWVAMSNSPITEKMIRAFAAVGADMNVEDKNGHPSLYLAIVAGNNKKTIATMIECGCTIDYDSATELIRMLKLPRGTTPETLIKGHYSNMSVPKLLRNSINASQR